MNLILAMISGVMGALAHPRASLWPLAFVFLVPLFFSIRRSRSYKEVLLSALLFGLIYFGALFSGMTELYLYVSFWAYAAWIALAAFQSLFIVVFCALAAELLRRDRPSLQDLFAAPSIWVVIEWARALGPFGVTGGDVGYSLAGVLPLIQISSITGVWGVSFLAVLSNFLIFTVISRRGSALEKFSAERGKILIVMVLVTAAALFGFYRMASLNEGASSFRVAMIQPNIAQMMKLNYGLKDRVLDVHLKLTGEIIQGRPDLIIWPETAIMTYLRYDKPVLSKLSGFIARSGAYFLVGAPEWEGGKAYNSAFLLSPKGALVGRYDKQRLVPFGEYIPLRALLYPILRATSDFFGTMDYGYDASKKAALLAVGSHHLGVVICFESTFPQTISDRVRDGADDIIVITNDAWFGMSSLAAQHLDSGVFRAVETGVPLIQVGNTGYSAIIAPSGKVLKKTILNRAVAMVQEVPEKAKRTFYVRYGDVFVWALIVYLLVLLVVRRLSSYRAM